MAISIQEESSLEQKNPEKEREKAELKIEAAGSIGNSFISGGANIDSLEGGINNFFQDNARELIEAIKEESSERWEKIKSEDTLLGQMARSIDMTAVAIGAVSETGAASYATRLAIAGAIGGPHGLAAASIGV